MDWSIWLELSALLLAGVAGLVLLYRFEARTQSDFRAQQPSLRVTNLSAMTSGDTLTLAPELDNIGGGVAYDCLLQLGGWDGSFAVNHIYPRNSRTPKQTIAIVLGPEAPIRTKPMSNGYLRLRYRDRWGLLYECWYPVSQQKHGASPLYTIQVDLANPDRTEPNPSLWERWKLLQTASTQEQMERA